MTISNENNILWDSLGTSSSISVTATFNSIYKEGNIVHCYSVECGSYQQAIEKTYAWADEVTNNEKILNFNALVIESENTIGTDPDGSEIEAFHDRQCGNQGWMFVRTYYYQIVESNSNYEYYSGHYTTQIQPNSDIRNSGLDVKSVTSNGILLAYGPYSTSRASTAIVDIGSVGLNGVSLTLSRSWSYKTGDIIVMDYSSFGTNTLDCRHNINEKTNVGSTNCTVEPGKIIKISTNDNDGNYSGTDTYKAQFCKHWLLGYKNYNDYSSQFSITII